MKKHYLLLFILILLLALVISERIVYSPAPVPEASLIYIFEKNFESGVSDALYLQGLFVGYEPKFNYDEICVTSDGLLISKYKDKEIAVRIIKDMKADSDFCVEPIDGKVRFKFTAINNSVYVSIP